LFGTSANPPTGSGGHVGIVQALSSMPNTTKFDEIRILPVYQHTFSSKRNQLVSYEHRVNMCKIAFEGIPRAIVSNAEEESFQRVAKDK
jgi:nicotinic acid mononucleotide adenylyltransferase